MFDSRLGEDAKPASLRRAIHLLSEQALSLSTKELDGRIRFMGGTA